MANNPSSKNKEIPKVLEQRLLLKPEHRKILEAIDDLSPKDLGYLFIPGAKGREVPTVGMVATKITSTPALVRESMKEIKDIWGINDNLPTNQGRLNEEESIISALTNQHRLRWDKEINDYRVPRVMIYNAEIGTGTEYTRNSAFEGERIFRNSSGINEVLNSYLIQGGIMPQIMAMYGKIKAERGSLTGRNSQRTDDEDAFRQELDQLKSDLKLAQKKNLTPKQISNLEEYVVGTLDSMPEAARSVAKELVPLVSDIPSHVPIHLFCSYNDDFNMEEITDLLIAGMKLVRRKAKEAKEQTPVFEEDLSSYQSKKDQFMVNVGVADYISKQISEKKELSQDSEEEELPRGKLFREMVQGLFEGRGTKGKIATLKRKLKKTYGGDNADFEDAFQESQRRYFLSSSVMNLDDIVSRRTLDEENQEKTKSKIRSTKDKLAELKQYEAAYEAQESEGHAWFTKKIAITPTQAKAMKMATKELYKQIYTEILIPELESIIGRELKVKLHTDREISIYIPDPSALLEKNEYPSDQLYGTIITSIPRPNRQRSNEPALNSMREIQGKHESAVTSRTYTGKDRPLKVDEFDKRHSTAFSDVIWTSWGAEGFQVQPRLVIAPTQVDGEYRSDTERVFYVKSTTRHGTKALSEMAKRGNRGTWAAKRIDKGGPTTGNAIQIQHPDGSVQWAFVDDRHYEKIDKQYGETIRGLEKKLSKTNTVSSKKKIEAELQRNYSDIARELNNIFLVNDTHLGAVNMPGRPTNVDYIRSSQLIVLQTYGLDGIDVVAGTEFMHGKMEIGKWGYSSVLEGNFDDPVASGRNINLLTEGLQQLGYDGSNLVNHLEAYVNEQMFARPTFRPNDQIKMFKQVLKPVFDELLAARAQVVIGSGNHWNSSVRGLDEAETVAALFDDKYQAEGTLKVLSAYGQSQTNHPFLLPSDDGERITAVLAHKMWHGNTEISRLSQQAAGQREDALIYLVADRHQPGIVAEREKYFVLDCGKQTTMDYVRDIGKVGSVRGAMVTSYSPRRDLLFSTRFFLDNVVDDVINWKHRSGVLERSHSIIKDGLIESYKTKK